MASERPMRVHVLERTSPLGERFYGRCLLCGESGLTSGQANEPCENPMGVSDEVAFRAALHPDRHIPAGSIDAASDPLDELLRTNQPDARPRSGLRLLTLWCSSMGGMWITYEAVAAVTGLESYVIGFLGSIAAMVIAALALYDKGGKP